MTIVDPIAVPKLSSVSTPAPVPATPPQTHSNVFVVDGVSWDLYEHIVAELPRVRVTYDSGRMALMSPLQVHEAVTKLTARMIEVAALELNIPCYCLGSTTWKRKDLAKGLEPNECFYVQHEPNVRGRTDVDLSTDPPPDLVLEVDITHHPMNRLSIYGSLGVNEVWQFDGAQIAFLKLGSTGTYNSLDRSEAFPILTAEIINRHLAMLRNTGQHQVIVAFRDWLRTLPGGAS